MGKIAATNAFYIKLGRAGEWEAECFRDGTHRRRTIHGWHTKSANGTLLSSDRLSGNLLKLQMFRGTICSVKPFAYLLRKLNDEVSPDVAAAEKAERMLIEANTHLMRLLTWQDFEPLVDLVFSSSGWRRVGQVGRTTKTLDLDLVLLTTGERALVQVKARTDNFALEEYAPRFRDADLYDRMFFVWHSGSIEPSGDDHDGVTLIGPERLSQMVLDAGLSAWLRERVS